MIRWLLLMMLFGFAGIVNGQSVLTDSLRQVLTSLPPSGRSVKDDTLRVSVLCELGKLQAKDDTAIQLFEQALALSQKRNWERGQMWATCWLGFYKARRGAYYQAMAFLFDALRLAEKLRDGRYMGLSMRYLGDRYHHFEDYPKALYYYQKARPFLKQAGEQRIYLVCLNNIGLSYFQQRNYAVAIRFFNQCLLENKPPAYFEDVAGYCFLNLSASYRETEDYTKAILYLNRFEKLRQKHPDDIAWSRNEMATVLMRQANFRAALRYAQEAYALRQSALRVTKMKITNNLWQIYQELGAYRQSLYYYQEYEKLQEQDVRDMQKKQIDALRVRYENERHKAYITLQRSVIRQKELQRNGLATGLALVLLLTFTLYYTNWLLKRKKKQVEEQKLDLEVMQQALASSNESLSELNQTLEERVRQRTQELTRANEELIRKNREISEAFYRGQSQERRRVASELHDTLGGTLAALKWQLESIDSEHLSPPEQRVYGNLLANLESAYTEVRLISHNMMPEELEKAGLAGALQKLVDDLNRTRRLVFVFLTNCEDERFERSIEIELYSIGLELVNNVLKHARATEAVLKLHRLPVALTLEISDNGVGMPSRDPSHRGMGMNNIKSRVERIHGRLDTQTEAGQGTRLAITVPLFTPIPLNANSSP